MEVTCVNLKQIGLWDKGKGVNLLLCTNSMALRLRKHLIVNICKVAMPLTFSSRRDKGFPASFCAHLTFWYVCKSCWVAVSHTNKAGMQRQLCRRDGLCFSAAAAGPLAQEGQREAGV